jgi:hypothetical protein
MMKISLYDISHNKIRGVIIAIPHRKYNNFDENPLLSGHQFKCPLAVTIVHNDSFSLKNKYNIVVIINTEYNTIYNLRLCPHLFHGVTRNEPRIVPSG